MRPLRLVAESSARGVVLTDAAAIYLGAIVDERLVVDSRDTVLDPEICENGSWIELPIPCLDYKNEPLERVYYPAFDHQRRGRLIHLHRMAVLANMLLRTIVAFREGTATDMAVQKMVLSYQYGAIRQLGGKKGVVNANLIAGRVMRSARGILVVNGDRPPEYVGVPAQVVRKLKLDDESLVFVGREPSIWHGSIEVVKVRTNHRYCIELHPLLFKQLGADCDGDTVYLYAIPDDPRCQEEAREQVLGFTKGFAQWPSYLRQDGQGSEVDWKRVFEEGRERNRVTGFSVTPREILEQGPRLKALCQTMGKDVAQECLTIAKGIDEKALKQYVHDQNDALLHMKIWMGPIGAASNRLRIFAGTDQTLLASASYVSERLQQMLLDTKHHVGRQENYGVTHVLDILNRRGRFSSMSPVYLEDVVDELARLGMDREKVWPIMAQLWLIHPLVRAFDVLYTKHLKASGTALVAFRQERMRACIRDFHSTRSMKACLEKLAKMGKVYKVPVSKSELLTEYQKHAWGLNKLCQLDYPLMQLISERTMSDRNAAFEIARQIFHDGRKDLGGVTRLALEEALNVR